MRKSKKDAAETRSNIVKSASGLFRAKGIAATGLADIMEAVGLTHGGFYKHFESKDQLVRESIELASSQLIGALSEVVQNKSKWSKAEAVVKAYLSREHRDGLEWGCPLAGIGSELGRTDEKSRAAVTEGVQRFIDVFKEQLGDSSSPQSKKRATATVSLMVGALTLSRVVSDPDLANELLDTAAQAALEISREKSSKK